MKCKSFAIILSSLLLNAPAVFGSVFVIDEGLDNKGTNSGIAGSGKAANFIMDAGGDYTLDSIVLGLGSIDLGANPEIPRVELWSDDGTGAPIGSLLETLTNPGTLMDGTNTFTSSAGTTLTASTTYWVVVTNDDGVQSGSGFDWLGGNDSGDTIVTSDIGATHGARLFGPKADRAAWTKSSGVLNQIQVMATAVPEPSTYALVSGMLALGWIMVRRRRA